MIPLTPTEILPLETDADGVVCVGKTRVTLDTIIMAFTGEGLAKKSFSPILSFERVASKAVNNAVSVESRFSLLRGEKGNRIAAMYDIVDLERLTDSLSSSLDAF